MSTENKNKKTKDSKFKKIINKPIVKGLGICTLMGVSLLGGFTVGREVGINSPATIKYYSSNSKIATVNGEAIYGKDFKASMNILFHMNKDRKMTEEEISTYENQLLDYTTMNKAIYDVAVKENFKVDEESVKLNYSNIMKQLEEMLNMKEDEILDKFKLSKSGIMESLRQEYITNLYLDKNSTFTEKDALNYYNSNPDEFYQYKASHILISTYNNDGTQMSEADKAKAKAKAEGLLEQIKKGANFEDLAKENSQDGTAKDGGDLGYFKKGDMVPEFETAVSKTEIGQLHPEIVETNYGYHIIKRTGESKESFEDAKVSIIDELSYKKKSEIIEKIRKESDIKILYKK